MATKDRLEKLAKELSARQPEKKRSKHNRTLTLDQERFLKLQAYCKKQSLKPADVVDRLIEEFLTTLEEAGELLEME